MRVNSALGQVGLGQLGPVISAWSYIAFYFQLRMAVLFWLVCVSLKNAQQKFEGIMFGRISVYRWSVNLDYISLLNGSDFITACKERKM